MLMARVTESFEKFMVRFVRQTVRRLIADEDIHVPPDLRELGRINPLLAEIGMAAQLRAAVDQYLVHLIVYRGDPRQTELEALTGKVSPRPTWKEIGKALGVSAQAAHRKYGDRG
jgi:hypothetical protein